MKAHELMDQLRVAGCTLRTAGESIEVVGILTNYQRDEIRARKPELLQILINEEKTKRRQAIQWRRQEVLGLIRESGPEIRLAHFVDSETEPDHVIVALAIRNVATCELHIPRDRYDPRIFLEILQRNDIH